MLKKIISAALSTCIVCAGLALPASAKTYYYTNTVTLPGWESSMYNTPTANTETEDAYNNGKTGVEITTDAEQVKEGNGTLHLFCEEQTPHLYARARQKVNGLEKGNTYRLSGKVKASGSGYRYSFRFGDRVLKNINNAAENFQANEWVDVKYDFPFNESSNFFTIHLEAAGDIYADNLSICEIITDKDGNETLGENLLVNGDFEMGLEASDEVTFTEQAEYVMNADEKSAQMRVLAASEFEGEATDYGFWIVDTRNMSAKDHEVSSAGEVLKSGDTFYTDINIELTNNEGEKVTPTQMTVYAIPWITFSDNNVVSGEAFTYNGDLTTKTVIKDKTKTFN